MEDIRSQTAPKERAKAKRERRDLANPKTKTQLANDRFETETKRYELLNEHLKWDGRLRLVAAIGVFGVVLGWLLAVLAVVLLQSCPWANKLTDTVLVALLATTTANVLLLLHTVVRYLFPQRPDQPKGGPPPG